MTAKRKKSNRKKKKQQQQMVWGLAGVVVIALVLFFVFQSGQQEPLPEGVVAMQAGNLFFSPKTLTAVVNEEVVLNVGVTGRHTFTIDALGVDVRLNQGKASVRFTPNQTGTFEYYCAIPGHRERGMLGTLRVTAG